MREENESWIGVMRGQKGWQWGREKVGIGWGRISPTDQSSGTTTEPSHRREFDRPILLCHVTWCYNPVRIASSTSWIL